MTINLSFQEMEEDLRKDDLTSVKDRIATAKEDFKNDLERLYTAHAEEYLDDQRLRRESREDYKQSDGRGRWVEWFEKRDVCPYYLSESQLITLLAGGLHRSTLYLLRLFTRNNHYIQSDIASRIPLSPESYHRGTARRGASSKRRSVSFDIGRI